MIFEQKYKIGVEDIGVDNYLSNKGILAFLEDIACLHAATVGFGVLDVERRKMAWILLEWRVKVTKRPIYNTIVTVKTWVEKADRLLCIRNFEMTDENGEVFAIATSKWVLMDIHLRKMVKLTEEYVKDFGVEPDKKSMLNEEIIRRKFTEPENYEKECMYDVKRLDIDMNHHLHNLNYLYIAYEILPEEVFVNKKFNQITIEYKKEIKYGDKVKCYYYQSNGEHIVVLKVDEKVHAIVALS